MHVIAMEIKLLQCVNLIISTYTKINNIHVVFIQSLFSETACTDHHCDYKCVSMPYGSVCRCRQGYQVQTNGSCQGTIFFFSSPFESAP